VHHLSFAESRPEPALAFLSGGRFGIGSLRDTVGMKKLPEILVSIVLHPIAVFLMIANLLGRDDLNVPQRIFWIVFGAIGWGIGPILYVTLGGGDLW